MYNRGEHGNDERHIDDVITDLIPAMESALLSGNRQLLPNGIGDNGYADIPGEPDWSEHDAKIEQLTAGINWLVGKSSR